MTDSINIFYLPTIINIKHKIETIIIIKYIKWVHASQFQIIILKLLETFLNRVGNILLQWTRRIYE